MKRQPGDCESVAKSVSAALGDAHEMQGVEMPWLRLRHLAIELLRFGQQTGAMESQRLIEYRRYAIRACRHVVT